MSSIPQCLRELNIMLQHYSRKILDLPRGYRRAAVLIPLFQKEDKWYLVFTRRTENVSQHKNEISFPGGRFDHNTRLKAGSNF